MNDRFKGISQPVPSVDIGDVSRVLQRDFPSHILKAAQGELDALTDTTARTAIAVLKLANGSLDRLREAVQLSNKDVRDVISNAEYSRFVSLSAPTNSERSSAINADWAEYSTWLQAKAPSTTSLNSLPKRPFRRGICDGDDVWPLSLNDDELLLIAGIDAETKRLEGEPPAVLRVSLGGTPVYSLAERVRHWQGLVEDTETANSLHPGEYMTELNCRDLVESNFASFPKDLRGKLLAELLDPLDERFKLTTLDDGGVALAREVKLDDASIRSWRWARRPITLGKLWDQNNR